jgi:Ca2+-binding EF-hand superfamily protein
LITLNKYDSKSFSDNVFQAYTLIEKDHGNSGVKGIDFIKLAQMLCIDYPAEILHGILRLLDKREEENVEFDEFLCGIKTILMFDNYFEEMEQLFRYLDVTKVGKIKKDDLVFSVKKVNQQRSELRVPTAEDVEMVYTQIDVTEDGVGVLNYDEYLILLFKTALDNFGAE